MMNAINYSLPAAKTGHAARGQASKAPVAGPHLSLPADSFKLSPKAEREIDDYARRHAEAFGPKQPPKSDSGKKFDLGWQIDEATRLTLKPSLKKVRVELKVKF